MKTTLHKNQKGFSHHFILPVLAVLLVAGIGGVVMLRGSSAQPKDNCWGARMTTNWTTCKDMGYLFSTWKGKYYQYKVRIAKTDSKYKYIEVQPLSKVYKFDNGHTKVYVTPGKWSISCSEKKNGATTRKDNLTGKHTLKFSKKVNYCGVGVDYTVVQHGPQDGYTAKHDASKFDSFKV